MTRRGLLALAAAPREQSMNVVVILADDLGYGDLGCYGSRVNRTPNLDRLALDGVRFTGHYSCSPVCSPARAALLTGQVPERTGVTGVLREEHDDSGLALGLRTMADHFRASGRKTALIGKWHLGMNGAYRPNRRGFDYFWGFLNGVIDYQTHRSTGGGGRGTVTTHENETPLRLEGYYPDLLTNRVVEFVERNGSQPYFLYYAHPLPHLPLQVPERWSQPFRASLDEKRAVYAGMVAHLDDSVGRLRAALERTGQWERTIVLFLSDNGWVMKQRQGGSGVGSNGPLRGGKYELYEGGIRVPCLLRWPGVTRAGTEIREPSWFADWVPTLTGIRTPDGADLRPLFAGNKPKERALRWRFEDRLVKTPLSVAVRRGRWKLIDVGGEEALFDLESDPGEARSLIAHESAVASRLRAYATQR